jgi:hypothetical protein
MKRGQHTRRGCCHHGAILRVNGGRNLGSETATARPTVLDNFMGVSFAARAARRNGFDPYAFDHSDLRRPLMGVPLRCRRC